MGVAARRAGDLRPALRAGLRAFAAGVALLALAACGAVPRPFMPDPEAPYPLSQMHLDDSVEVRPVTGVPTPMGKLLAARVAEELVDYGVPAAAQRMQSAGYVLQGHAEPAPPGKPYVAVLTWRLVSAEGAGLGRYRHGVGGAYWQWDYGSPAVIEAVGSHVGGPLAKLILGDRFAGEIPAMPQDGVWIGGVENAPGDGNRALARALGIALRNRDIPVSRTPDAARFHLTGDVEVSPPDDGQQIVRITWRLSHPDGREVGAVRQRNAVPAGALDARWRATATYAAVAAVGGIRDLMRQVAPDGAGSETPAAPPSRRTRPRAGDDAPDAGVPPVPDLPQVPGRALPPS